MSRFLFAEEINKSKMVFRFSGLFLRDFQRDHFLDSNDDLSGMGSTPSVWRNKRSRRREAGVENVRSHFSFTGAELRTLRRFGKEKSKLERLTDVRKPFERPWSRKLCRRLAWSFEKRRVGSYLRIALGNLRELHAVEGMWKLRCSY